MSRMFQASPDFPNASYEAIFIKVKDKFAGASKPVIPTSKGKADAWTEFTGGWNAVKARFESCTDASETYTNLLKEQGSSPPPPGRFTQDNELFIFFFAGLSVVESFCYSLYSLGNLLSPPGFPMGTDRDLKRCVYI